MSTPAARYAAVLLVGPKPLEVERLADLAEAIAAHEPTPGLLVVVDDPGEGVPPRDLAGTIRAHAAAHVTPVQVQNDRRGKTRWVPDPLRKGTNLAGGLMRALDAAHRALPADAAFVLKLDTDALVIGPFFDAVANAFAARPGVGMLGATTVTPNGDARDLAVHVPRMKRLAEGAPLRPLGAWWRERRDPALKIIRAHYALARAHGYPWGEHPLGGAAALSRAALAGVARVGAFDDLARWDPLGADDDVILGMYARAAGFAPADFVGRGEAFGVRWQGLPCSPEECVARGYAAIHAVKNDKQFDEATIRAFFKARRGKTTQG